MKKWIAMLLVFTAVLCTACSQEPEVTTEPKQTTTEPTQITTDPTTQPTTETTEPPTMANEFFDPVASAQLIDTWSMDVVLDGSLLNFTDMETSTTMKLNYQLMDDGTYIRGVDQKEYDAAIASYESAVRSYMLGQRYAKFAAEQKLKNKKEDKIKEEWTQTGWPEAQVEVNAFVEGLHLGYRFSTINRSGDYYTQDSILYLSQADGTYEACTYQLTEAGLQLMDSTDPNTYRQLKLNFPLTLTNGTLPADPTQPTEAATEGE